MHGFVFTVFDFPTFTAHMFGYKNNIYLFRGVG